MTVGQVGIPASISVRNQSNGAEATGTITLTSIEYVPSCGPGGCTPDPGVFALSATGTGRAGTSCAATVFDVVQINAAQGRFRFVPRTAFALGAPSGPTPSCTIDFTFDVLKVPTQDALPGSEGTQTNQLVLAEGVHSNGAPAATGLSTTINVRVRPVLAPDASEPVVLGGQISATATLTGSNPTGQVVFRAYGPDNLTCAGPSVFLSFSNVTGNGTYASEPFTPTAPGTYHWTVSYNGDSSNASTITACNDPNASVVVSASGTPPPGGGTPPPPGGGTPPPPGGGTPPPPGGTAGRTINGTPGRDNLVGTPGDDVINCGDGDDTVRAGTGNDVINCGAGNDTIDGGGGDDTVDAGEGDDTVRGAAGDDRLDGGAGRDRLAGNSGKDRASGGAGRDRVGGGSGNDRLGGGSGADRLSGDSGRDSLSGGSGPDRLFGGLGNDVLRGGSGNDRLSGGPARDRLIDGAGKDVSRQ